MVIVFTSFYSYLICIGRHETLYLYLNTKIRQLSWVGRLIPDQICRMVEKFLNWELILPVYKTFFQYSRRLGLFPYYFDSVTLELNPVSSGFAYYFFLFNAFYFVTNFSKVIFLFLFKLNTTFVGQDIPGGNFFHQLWIAGLVLVLAMLYGFTSHRKEFGCLVSSCIRLERENVQSKISRCGWSSYS